MRPGRLPEDDPLEQQARDELREKQGEKPQHAHAWQTRLVDDPDLRAAYVDRDVTRWTAAPEPRRWTQ